ncbi:MAG: hypothetical protein HYX69_01530 [Planctomycetia bacterium]|nr:hypothetical protein [Planctomycetia bacterium]
MRTSRFFAGAVAAWTLFNVCPAAYAGSVAGGAWVAVLATGQSGARAPDPRREAAELVARARKAMSEGDWKAADALLTRAESFHIQYNRFNFLGDTPAKARRDLERARPAGGAPTAGPPSRPQQMPSAAKAQASSSRKPVGAVDPFAAREAAAGGAGEAAVPPTTARAQAAMSDEPQRVPRPESAASSAAALQRGNAQANDGAPASAGGTTLDGVNPAAALVPDRTAAQQAEPSVPADVTTTRPSSTGAGQRQVAAAPRAGEDPRVASDRLLVAARKAMAVGDTARATQLVAQAKALPARRDVHDDAPAKVEATLRKQVDLAAQGSGKDSEALRRRRVELLMEQAEGLLLWREFDEAERLAEDAKRLPVSFNLFDSKPDDLLSRIAASRRQAGRFRDNRVMPATFDEPSPGQAAASASADSGAEKAKVTALVAAARARLNAGDAAQAQVLAGEAARMGVPESAFAANEDRPSKVLAAAQKRRAQGPAVAPRPADESPTTPRETVEDVTRLPDPTKGGTAGATGLFETARSNEPPADLFNLPDSSDRPARTAVAPPTVRASAESPSTSQPEPDVVTTEPPPVPAAAGPAPRVVPEEIPHAVEPGAGSLLTKTATDQKMLERKIAAELATRQSEAKRLQPTDPKQSLEILKQTRTMVEQAGVATDRRDQWLRSMDRRIAEVEQLIETNRPRIELDERNRAVKAEIEREQQVKVEVQEKLAYLVDQFNDLMDQQRYAEAETVAKRAAELAPKEAVVEQIRKQAVYVRRLANIRQVEGAKEDGFVEALISVDEAAEPFDDRKPIRFAKDWASLSKSPFRQKREGRLRRSEKELEIEQRLKTPVSLKFQDAPLSQVMDYLAKLAQVNLHLDPRGLAQEGVTTDTPVTIDLAEPISLKSALNLILEPLHLSYVIKNEVLNVTSEQLRDNEVYTVTYNVADLVIPIPNFTPGNEFGLTGALNAAQANARAGMLGSGFGAPAALGVVASAAGSPNSAVVDPRLLAQVASATGSMGPMATVGHPGLNGPGGLGGGARADFDSLIDLITSTIHPDSWDENSGPGTVSPYQNNLSLVISQKQEVHDEIAELLAQLRRLHDLQVTIEVRFITLNDNFFERIGVDFDFNLEDFAPASILGAGNVGTLAQGSVLQAIDPQLRHNEKRDITVGLAAPQLFTADLDIPFRQDSFTASVPQFGFVPNTGASLGFAILSDIEAFFFIEAAQGDRRSNVMQAPKVTLFNGQQAFVTDTSQSPFVISVVPVVGDFAAAQQPVIVVLSEGTFLSVQAVVSEDRRFVRVTIVPFFSTIGDVNTFTFDGSTSTTAESASTGQTNDTTGRSNRTVTTTQGTTVQLPTFSIFNVSTTVSVPDGGTVLLGGIKRLSEGRNEFGIPVLSKIPYLNRLFRNVGIGRETQSLMMMVSPRIIIQEEEEFNLTGQQPPP